MWALRQWNCAFIYECLYGTLLSVCFITDIIITDLNPTMIYGIVLQWLLTSTNCFLFLKPTVATIWSGPKWLMYNAHWSCMYEWVKKGWT